MRMRRRFSRKRLFKKKNKSEGTGVPSDQTVKGGREYLAGFMLGVSLTRDFYIVNTIDNTLLLREIVERYESDNCELIKRERLYEDLVKRVDELWNKCQDIDDKCEVYRYLKRVSKVFYENAQRYVNDALKIESEFAQNIFLALAENEIIAAHNIETKYTPEASV